MKLNLYRRHRGRCEAGKGRGVTSSELDERRKDWGRRCGCEIAMSGVLGGKFSRKTTHASDWENARRVAEAYEQADSWTGKPEVKPAPPEQTKEETSTPARATIVEACRVYITHQESAGLEPSTLSKHRTLTNRITAFGEGRGYVLIDQFVTGDIDIFWASWKLGARTKGKRLSTLRGFFRFCVGRKWMAESPVSADIKPPVGSSKAANKWPFTDEELQRIIAACDKPPCPPRGRNSAITASNYVGAVWKNDQGIGEWTGEDLKDIIWLMVYTGYRISDATFFDMKLLQGNQVFIRATKNGGEVFAYLPDWLRDRLLERAKVHGNRPFIVGRSHRLETVTNVWRRRIAQAFEAAGEFEQPPTPHRFRHTFARVLLQKGVSVADVADLMGDDEETIRAHYSRWIPERQERLTRILQDAFEERPKPKLVGIQGGRS